jgi:integrase
MATASPTLSPKQIRELTLEEFFAYEARMKPGTDPTKGVPAEVARMTRNLKGIVDQRSGVPILEMTVDYLMSENEEGRRVIGQVIGDLIADGPFKEADLASARYKDGVPRRGRSNALIARLDTMFNQHMETGNQYVLRPTQNYLGQESFAINSGVAFRRSRKTLLEVPDDTYEKLKFILADEEIDPKVRNVIGLHAFSGMRPENVRNIKVENINFETGEVTFYDAKAASTIEKANMIPNRTIFLNTMALDFMKEIVGDRVAGPMLENEVDVHDTASRVLSDRVGLALYELPDKTKIREGFTLYDLRRLFESQLADQGLKDDNDIRALNGRLPADTAGGYRNRKGAFRRIDTAAKAVVASMVGYSGTRTISQYGNDIGMDFSDTTKKIVVSKDILVGTEYMKTLKKSFLDSLPGEFGMLSSDDIEPADAESSKQFQEESRADSRLRAAEKTERAIELEEKNNQRDQKRAAQAADADLDGKTQPAPGEFSPEGKALMIELGMWNEQYENYDSGDDAPKADKPEAPEAPDKPETPGDGKPGFGTTTSMLTAGVAGTAAMLLDPAQALADEAIQQSGEAATRGIIGKTLARRIPFAEIAIPSDLSADPQENLAKAYNVSPSVFYQMTPEQMAPYQQALDDAIAKQKQEAIDRRKGRNRARVGKNFLEEQP